MVHKNYYFVNILSFNGCGCNLRSNDIQAAAHLVLIMIVFLFDSFSNAAFDNHCNHRDNYDKFSLTFPFYLCLFY
jgi:hypothetical protein